MHPGGKQANAVRSEAATRHLLQPGPPERQPWTWALAFLRAHRTRPAQNRSTGRSRRTVV